ncbi:MULTISPECIES: HAMP domain-containing sensor histidine kinase [unclassified Novosphingobium]|uniref:sensor histidine kinase n=1 Tax=unclassified Novosphingobium TaxID=2644732 RepID=UPI00190FA86E|nr:MULTISPECIES: HAMP domain-containing sensor histidine kinase [unclassified Novosphingobium]
MLGTALFRSTTARFVLLAFVLQFLVTGGVLVFVQEASQRALAAEQREAVGELRDELTAAWRGSGDEGLRRLIRARLEITHGAVAVILYAAPDGTPIAGNLDAWPTVIPPGTRWLTIDLYRAGSERPERMGVTAVRLPDGKRLLAGHVIESSLRLVRVNEEAVLGALVAGLALTLLGALVIGRVLSSRIEAITQTASAVGGGALAARVPVSGSGDAFDRLGLSINAMLERIEGLISQLRMITDGLAHDLRSPVTRMKVLIERAAAETEDDNALGALERVAQEADTLLRMLSTALQISRAEAGIGRERFSEIEVAMLLEDLVEIYGPLAEDSGFALGASSPPNLHATLHREFISQALGNLIENAVKYAEGGSRISLYAREEGSQLVLTVADDGPGIPPEHRAEALRRFGRLDPSRHLAGSGLGLSLVEAAARLHDGDIRLADNAPGLRVELWISGSSHRG